MNTSSYSFRILASFGVAALLFALALGVSIRGIGQIDDGFTELELKANVRMRSLNDMFGNGLFAGIATRNKVFKPQLKKPWDVLAKVGEQFASDLAKVRQFTKPGDSESKQLLDAIETRWTLVHHARLEVLRLVEAGRAAEATRILAEREHPNWKKIRIDLQTLMRSQEAAVTQLGKAVKEQAVSSRGAAIGVGLVALLLGFAIFGLTLRSLRRGLRDVTATLEAIADGDGDLTRRLDDGSGSELAAVARAFNRFAEKIQDLVREVVASTEQLSAAAEQMSVITRESQNGISRQRQETDQVATAIDEMASTIQEVARNTADAAEQARQAAADSQEGQRTVVQASEAIRDLAEEIEGSVRVVGSLAGESQNIGGVLEVIAGIAEQTNLLALNAAIEAARAGDQGRGFAVVADEVRTLASRTQQSTEEIRAMIERLQAQASGAVGAMEKSRAKTDVTVDYARATGESLAHINGRIGTLSDQNGQIATAAEEQSAVAEELSRNVNNIRVIADEAADNAGQMASAGDNLARLAGQLQGLVYHFKV